MFKIEKKMIKSRCWSCNGKGCRACKHTGQWEESIYYHIFKGKDGKLYCVDGDFIK